MLSLSLTLHFNIVLEVSQTVDAYFSFCVQTEDFDYAQVFNGWCLMTHLAILLLTSAYVWWYMNTENEQGFLGFFECPSFKTVTIGILAILGFMTIWFLGLMDEDSEETQPHVSPLLLIVPLAILLINVIKEKEVTGPFLTSKLIRLKKMICCRSSTVDPLNQPADVSIIELNPRNFGPQVGSNRIIDDGGIYVGKLHQ